MLCVVSDVGIDRYLDSDDGQDQKTDVDYTPEGVTFSPQFLLKVISL